MRREGAARVLLQLQFRPNVVQKHFLPLHWQIDFPSFLQMDIRKSG